MQDNTINELDHKFFTLDLDMQSQYLRVILSMIPVDFVDQILVDMESEVLR